MSNKYIERGPKQVGVNGRYLITIWDGLTGEKLLSMMAKKPMKLESGQKAEIRIIDEI